MSNQNIKSFKVYQASAGSGKTYTIVKEYLALCLKNKTATAKFSQILAITFTNMAANEMKAKIVKHLVSIINSDLNTPPKDMEADLIDELGISRPILKENAQLLFSNIIHNYSNFFICTIDAFVQKLARSFAKDLGLPSQFNVSIDEEEVADEITERIGEQIESGNTYLTTILEDFAESKLEGEKPPKISHEIHNFTRTLFSEETFQGEENPFASEEKYKETLGFLNGKIHPFEARCKQFADMFNSFLQQYGLNPEHFKGKSRSACLSILKNLQKNDYPIPTASLLKIVDGETDWFSDMLPKQRGGAMEQINQDFDRAFIEPMRFYRSNVGAYHFYKAQFNKISLYVLRSKLKSELEQYIGEEQVVHISEFNKRINKLLGDFSMPFIYEQLGARLKHIFIDEFQDTSVLQWQNLLPLLNNSISSGQMSMVVGDGKQSIYRWRNGEVEQIVSLPRIYDKPAGNSTFEEFEHNLVNYFHFDELKTNYRSFQNIIDFNNDFFQASLKYLNEDCRKVYEEQHNDFGKDLSVIQLKKRPEPGYVQVELFDPEDNADQAMLVRIKELIDDLMDKGFQKSDITILVRKNKTGSLIADYLSRNSIQVISADSILLKSSPKVRLMISTLDYLIHPDNALTVASLLYYWNVAQQEQFDGTADGFFDQANAVAQGRVALEPLIGLESGAFKSLMVRSYSLYDLCSALIRLYGFDVVGDTYLSFLLETVYQWQQADETGIGHFLEYWEKKKNKLTVLNGVTDAVNIMTIHKSKGLEFKAVICPFIVDNLDDKKPSTFWLTPKELGFEAIPNIEKVQFTLTKDSASWTPQIQRLANMENAKVRLDNMNLNYVAFTRAIQRLHILSYKTKNTDKNPINDFLQTHPCSYGDPNTQKVMTAEEESETQEFYHASKSSEWLNKISIDPNPSMFWANPEDKMKPQEWGDFVHQVLSAINHAEDIDRALRPHLDEGVIDTVTADMLKSLFLQLAHHPLLAEAFAPEAKVKNECDILLSNGEIVRPDRYAELPDQIYLLDYKTGKPSEKHHEQLRGYVDVLKKMVNKKINAFLVYLDDAVEVIPVGRN